ncbi:SLC13 family permease [Amorphus orientalis]|uniref:Di/tricarboxylate transporter n=1 Tax=Amorphus orientalis TaxID=649198 RepID=A0AAE4AU70_9HYPH|nr:SLC13 family permease [Amorphus orientalis]MDQ0317083.1 di/tricarboxylate transporter [Amorphus orientalis]
MSYQLTALFALFVAVFAFLIWGRFRYDLVAFAALVIGVIIGAVPTDVAFTGFGHPATLIVALVLVVSRGLVNAGAIAYLARLVRRSGDSIPRHVATIGGIGALLSAFINNVAALALLMPVDLEAAKRASRPASDTLMALSFATILGGLVTMIGTPPNIIVAQYRATVEGAPFSMFDFTPVGLVCAGVGLAFIALIGRRLVPHREGLSPDPLSAINDYFGELEVQEGSKSIGRQVSELDAKAQENEARILGLVRNGKNLPGRALAAEIEEGDLLLVEGSPEALDRLRSEEELSIVGSNVIEDIGGGDMTLVEAVVTREGRAEGRSVAQIGLLHNHGVSLLGVSRQGKRIYGRVPGLRLRAGDILLLYGPAERMDDVVAWLGTLPLAERGLNVTQGHRAWLAAGLFGIAVGCASFGIIDLAIALAAVAVLYVVLDIVPIREVYDHIEWPVIVLLGSMIPLGAALEEAGGTALIAEWIVAGTQGLPAAAILAVVMIVTMTLSDVLNNTATAVVAAPTGYEIATRLDVSPDPFLMAVAVAASCAFLTPIGHKNNTLVLGPGGYQFGDYWRMGLPLEILIVAVGVPAILTFWPL